jgi:hypothetical protein
MIWLVILPAVSAVVTVAGISFKAGQILQKLNHVIDDVKELKQDVREIKEKMNDHEKRLTILETKIAGSNQKTT